MMSFQIQMWKIQDLQVMYQLPNFSLKEMVENSGIYFFPNVFVNEDVMT